MHAGPWLPLTDYASKYRVSISTLRRRIRGGHLAHRFEDGKYLIQDEMQDFSEPELPVQAAPLFQDEPIISSASRLLTELKRAYTNILHEKEEQIIQLKVEVSDLKTLVRVLEDENERLRRLTKQVEHQLGR